MIPPVDLPLTPILDIFLLFHGRTKAPTTTSRNSSRDDQKQQKTPRPRISWQFCVLKTVDRGFTYVRVHTYITFKAVSKSGNTVLYFINTE
jgi:hypothetical protein